MCSRLYFRHTSGSPVTCFKPDIAISSRAARILPWEGTLRTGSDSSESCRQWAVCFATEGSLQFHYTACAWTRRHVIEKRQKNKKERFKNMFEKACFLLLCCFGSFSLRVGWFLFLLLLLLHLHCNDVMKPCRDGRQMYITWIIVVEWRRRGTGSALF